MRVNPCLFVVALLCFLPVASAELDHWGPTPIANAIGGIAAGTINVYAQTTATPYGVVEGPAGARGEALHASVLLTAPAATTPVITWSITHSHGCTTSNPITTTTSSVAAFVSNFDFDITLTDVACTVVWKVLLEVGAGSTDIYSQEGSIIFGTQDTAFDIWLPILLFLAILLWGGYTRNLFIVLMGVVGVVVSFTGDVPFGTTWPLLAAVLIAATLAIRNSWRSNQEDREKAEKET